MIGTDLPGDARGARERATEEGVDLELRQGDMRDFELKEPAGSSTRRSGRSCTCRGLTSAASSSASRQPATGRQVRVECVRLRSAIAAVLHGQHLEEPVPHTSRQAPHESRVDLQLDSGPAISLWWATRNEWLGLIDVAELEVEALYGDFERGPFDEDSREFVWVARKPG